MFKRILVPLDGSHLAEAALPPALALAGQFDSELVLCRVLVPEHIIVHMDGTVYTDLLMELRKQSHQEARGYLEQHRQWLSHQGYRVRIMLVEDDRVAEAILLAVEDIEADLIVMSTHGRGGLSRWVYGSVADKLLQRAEVPILLTRASESTLDWELPNQPQMETAEPGQLTS